MNKLKWFILPVLMIVSFVLVSKPSIKAYDLPNGNFGYSVIETATQSLYYANDLDQVYRLEFYSELNDIMIKLSSMNGYLDSVEGTNRLYIVPQLGGNNWYFYNSGENQTSRYNNRLSYILFEWSPNVGENKMRLFDNVGNNYFTLKLQFLNQTSYFEITVSKQSDPYNEGYRDGFFGSQDHWTNQALEYFNSLDNTALYQYIDGVYYNITEYGSYMYNKGLEVGGNVLDNVWTLFEAVLNVIGGVFTLTIFPGVTLGTLFMIPISFAMFKWFLKIIK